ncbi:MAG TPA: HAMP domain-containing sensor histidine kinase, partial [Longimicrobiaceae bacterium]|nr:HAMP domain-containing sensor histidine kinase [Longimicrobiaceae bacterium]
GAADLLSGELDEMKRLKYAGLLRRGVDRITDMTQELLEYARGTTQLEFEKVSPRILIAELEEEVLRPLTGAGIQVHFAIGFDDPIRVDRRRFFRVLHNIVKNAAEAMPQGGTITITVEAMDDRAVFRVADTGVGIPPEVLPTIFEPFVSHGKAGGTGLGMAIVHSVVEAHGGTILVESTPGEGTSFTIAIPIADQPAIEMEA